MPFSSHKNLADPLQKFQVIYPEANFVKEILLPK